MFFKNKPKVIEAMRFLDTPEVIESLSNWMPGPLVVSYEDPKNPKLKIETLEGTMVANVFDYIIKGVEGEFYPCKESIFNKTYEAITK